MRRIYFIQHWFNLADLSCEEALYDSVSLRRFVGIDLGREPEPSSFVSADAAIGTEVLRGANVSGEMCVQPCR